MGGAARGQGNRLSLLDQDCGYCKEDARNEELYTQTWPLLPRFLLSLLYLNIQKTILGAKVLKKRLPPGGSGPIGVKPVPSLFQVRGEVLSRKIKHANLRLGTVLVTVEG